MGKADGTHMDLGIAVDRERESEFSFSLFVGLE